MEGARFLNIQILNSVAFSTVTGLPAPPTPVTPQVYAGYGLPYRKDYEDVDMDGAETSSELDGSTITGDSNAANSDAATLGASPNKSNPILSVQSVSRRDRLLLAAKRILPHRHVDPSAPATACAACEERERAPVRGQGLCDQILRPCGHAVCADCRDELVVEMMHLGLSAEVSGGAIFICPLCAEPVVGTVPFAAPMKVPEEEGRRPEVGFVVHGMAQGCSPC
jgi:hypothetical protein